MADRRFDRPEELQMIDHLGIPVRDYAASRSFYLEALAPLGIGVVMQVSVADGAHVNACGLGANDKPFFWIAEGKPQEGLHLAFVAATRAQVDGFYKAALRAGAKDNGAPGLRPHYHANYYGAFVIDPNGLNLEAVCHAPGS
jgi:catechol 2,3-dioxygenase-like lactoylglutathione lyase family enzyme